MTAIFSDFLNVKINYSLINKILIYAKTTISFNGVCCYYK